MSIPDALRARFSDDLQEGKVWTPSDFGDLGEMDVIHVALGRLVGSGEIRRISRGLYDKPILNALTKRPRQPDVFAVVAALSRRDSTPLLMDRGAAANGVGFTNLVPAKMTFHAAKPMATLKFDGLEISFKTAAPSRMFWAGRPGESVVQGLHWVRDVIPNAPDGPFGEAEAEEMTRIGVALRAYLDRVPAAEADLVENASVMPQWMKTVVRRVVDGESLVPEDVQGGPRP